MATHHQRSEQKAQAQVKAIIDEMLELDPETRVRAYRKIGDFFGYEIASPREEAADTEAEDAASQA